MLVMTWPPVPNWINCQVKCCFENLWILIQFGRRGLPLLDVFLPTDPIHISPVFCCCRHGDQGVMKCSIPDAIYAITSDTDMLNAPYSLFARYSLCTIMGSAMQRSTIIVQDNMLNGERPLPSRNRLCFQPTIASWAAIHILFTSLFHILWTLSNTSSSDKIAWFFCVTATPPLHDHHIIFCELQHILIDIRFVCWQTSGGGSKKRTMGTMQWWQQQWEGPPSARKKRNDCRLFSLEQQLDEHEIDTFDSLQTFGCWSTNTMISSAWSHVHIGPK